MRGGEDRVKSKCDEENEEKEVQEEAEEVWMKVEEEADKGSCCSSAESEQERGDGDEMVAMAVCIVFFSE